MSKKPTEEETRQLKKVYKESFGWIRAALEKFYTIDTLCEAIILLHNVVAIEGLYRAAEIGETKQKLLQMLNEELRKRKARGYVV